MYLTSYLSEGALGKADLANSPDGYYNYSGEGYDPAKIVGPVWVDIVLRCQGLMVQK